MLSSAGIAKTSSEWTSVKVKKAIADQRIYFKTKFIDLYRNNKNAEQNWNGLHDVW